MAFKTEGSAELKWDKTLKTRLSSLFTMIKPTAPWFKYWRQSMPDAWMNAWFFLIDPQEQRGEDACKKN